MSELKEIMPKELKNNVFKMIGGDWMLIAAEKDGKTNAMTASWGGLGVFWGSDVAYIFVRKSRYTKEFIDGSDTFTLNFLNPKEYREVQKYMGTISGRTEDKVAKTGLTVAHEGSAPYFAECDTVIVCTKAARFELGPDCIGDEDLKRWYADQDYHDLYIGKITKVLVKE